MSRLSLSICILLLLDCSHSEDNFLTGANDVIAVVNEEGDIQATPFHVQFGKKDIWLPRSGLEVHLAVNNEVVPVSMVLDSSGRGYFQQNEPQGYAQYGFWTALFGNTPLQGRTNSATSVQLGSLGLHMGTNLVEYQVTTPLGSVVTVTAVIHLVKNTAKFIVSDIDGTITKSSVVGMLLPSLGISDWKHRGVVELYSKIADQGYQIIYLTNRAIGQSDMTRSYLYSLSEAPYTMPRGPVLLQVESVLDALKTEVIAGQPEVNKIAALDRVSGLFPENPFVSGFGNKAWDVLVYKSVHISPNLIFSVQKDSRVFCEGTGAISNYSDLIGSVETLYEARDV